MAGSFARHGRPLKRGQGDGPFVNQTGNADALGQVGTGGAITGSSTLSLTSATASVTMGTATSTSTATPVTINMGGTSINGVRYTLDGGVTWATPVYGASVDMTGANWHAAYYLRRHIVQAFKGAAGVFYLFCNGVGGTGNAADLACLGLWKSTNGGANFTKIRPGHMVSFAVDYYQSKLKLNNNVAGHFFWVQGATNSYPTAPYAGGLFFSNDDGVNLYTLTGWSEPDDMAFGAKASSAQVYETIYVLGWRGGVYGVWASFDFDPTTRAATWVLQEQWLNGKVDNDNVIGADPTVFGRVIACPASGGITVGDYVDTASGT